MSEGDLLILLALAAIIGGLIGGLLAGLGTVEYLRRFRPDLIRKQIIQVEVEPLRIRTQVQTPDAVQIPVEVLPAPGMRELGQRVLAEYPDTGPRQLARLLNCSPSTAQGVIEEVKKGVA